MRRILANAVNCSVLLVGLFFFVGCEKPSIEPAAPTAQTPVPAADDATPAPADTADKQSPPAMGGMAKMAMPTDPDSIVFKDNVTSNVAAPQGLDGLVFFDTNSKRVKLADYLGKKNVVLVFTEGFAGMLCPFCKTQTSRLVANYDKFAALDTEILVVYPGRREKLDEFIEAAKTGSKAQVDRVPFPLLLDEDFRAVDYFDIRSNLAHPSTYVIDKGGNVRLAYVGNDMTADRPSVAALLKQVELAN